MNCCYHFCNRQHQIELLFFKSTSFTLFGMHLDAQLGDLAVARGVVDVLFRWRTERTNLRDARRTDEISPVCEGRRAGKASRCHWRREHKRRNEDRIGKPSWLKNLPY